MAPLFPDTRLRQAGVSPTRVTAIRAAYDAWSPQLQQRFRAWIATNPDEMVRRTYDPTAAIPAPVTPAQVAADPALLAAVQAAILAAHDTDAERETFIPARLSPGAYASPADVRDTDVAKARALRTFRAALANRDNARCNIVAFGDSMTEGPGSTAADRRWLNRLQALLNARYPTAGLTTHGDGFYPPQYITMTYTPPVTTTGSWTPNLSFGPGNRSLSASAAATMTYTVTGTSLSVMYVGSPTTGTFTVSVDGGAPVTVDSAQGTTFITDGRLYTVTGLAAAPHTVVVTWVSGFIYIDGIIVRNGDETTGITVYDAAHSGWTTGLYVQNGPYFYRALAAFAPDLVLIGLGENDIATGPVPSATYRTNLQTIIAGIRAQTTGHPPSIVLWAGQQRTGTYPEPWANYVQAMYDVAATDTGGPQGASGVTLLDLTRRVPPVATDNSLALFVAADGVHPTDKGHAFIADALAGFLAA
jgi:lysophospholipase L1-like esterase